LGSNRPRISAGPASTRANKIPAHIVRRIAAGIFAAMAIVPLANAVKLM
jgi:putative Ca2+/H+ antiporter (TMEM165/GDT1 family)